jgi:hypothetical protein
LFVVLFAAFNVRPTYRGAKAHCLSGGGIGVKKYRVRALRASSFAVKKVGS